MTTDGTPDQRVDELSLEEKVDVLVEVIQALTEKIEDLTTMVEEKFANLALGGDGYEVETYDS